MKTGLTLFFLLALSVNSLELSFFDQIYFECIKSKSLYKKYITESIKPLNITYLKDSISPMDLGQLQDKAVKLEKLITSEDFPQLRYASQNGVDLDGKYNGWAREIIQNALLSRRENSAELFRRRHMRISLGLGYKVEFETIMNRRADCWKALHRLFKERMYSKLFKMFDVKQNLTLQFFNNTTLPKELEAFRETIAQKNGINQVNCDFLSLYLRAAIDKWILLQSCSFVPRPDSYIILIFCYDQSITGDPLTIIRAKLDALTSNVDVSLALAPVRKLVASYLQLLLWAVMEHNYTEGLSKQEVHDLEKRVIGVFKCSYSFEYSFDSF